jgi:hypothetical protein
MAIMLTKTSSFDDVFLSGICFIKKLLQLQLIDTSLFANPSIEI